MQRTLLVCVRPPIAADYWFPPVSCSVEVRPAIVFDYAGAPVLSAPLEWHRSSAWARSLFVDVCDDFSQRLHPAHDIRFRYTAEAQDQTGVARVLHVAGR